MAYFRGFNSPKIPRGPRGIDCRSPNPRGMKKCIPDSPNPQGMKIAGELASLGEFIGQSFYLVTYFCDVSLSLIGHLAFVVFMFL